VRPAPLSRDGLAAHSAVERAAIGILAGALAIAVVTLGGDLEIDSPPGAGTRIAVTLRLRR
jgi:hypothetical protein